MGISLRNISKKVTDVLGGAERQINPFDKGATYNNPTPKPAAQSAWSAAMLGGSNHFPVAAPANPLGANAHTGPTNWSGVGKGLIASPISTAIDVTKSIPDLYDLATPGKGTNRVSQVLNKANQKVTSFAGNTPEAQDALRMGKTAELPLTLLSPGEAFKAAKGATTVAKTVADARTPLNEIGAVGNDVKAVIKPKAIVKVKPAARVESPSIVTPTGKIPVSGGKVSLVDKATKAPTDIYGTGILDKIDPRLGAMVRSRREIGETNAAIAKDRLKITNTLTPEEGTNLARVLKGSENPLNDKVAQAAKETKRVLDETYIRAKRTGVKVPGYRKNYFPQIHNPKTFKEGSNQFDSAVKHLVDTKQAKTESEAVGLLRKYKASKTLSPYQNLSRSRKLDLPNYAENVAALHQYLDRANAEIAHIKVMGVGDKHLDRVLNDVRRNGGDIDQAVASYKQASGLDRGSDTAEKISRGFGTAQGATKLGLSGIMNATQPVNTATVAGVGRTAKAYVKAFTKAGKAQIANTGVDSEEVAHEALFGEQGVSGKVRKYTSPLFEPIEKQNRRSAGIAGQDLASSLAKKAHGGDQKAAQRLANEFGITSFRGGKLTEADKIKAARSMVERTQFRTTQQDLPHFATTPTGKVLTQFKRYPYKQAQFIKKEVIDPARKGNLAPAARLAVGGGTVSLGANYVQGKIRGDNFKQTPIEAALDTANNVSGGDIVTSTARTLVPSSSDANSYAAKVGKMAGGPTVSDAINGLQAGFDATKGKFTKAERLALSHVPVVGTPISNKLLPYGTPTPKNGTIAEQKDKADKTLSTFKSDIGKQLVGKGTYQQKQLEDGRVAYTLSDGSVKTAQDANTAKQAIALDKFSKSKAEDKTIGNTYYYKDVNGAVKSKPLVEHQFDVVDSNNSLEMDRAYRASDLTAWTAAASSEYDSLENKKKLYNPNTEGDKITDIENKQADLLYKLQGYQEKGINGSGGSKSGGSGGSNPYAHVISSHGSTPSIKKPTVSVNSSRASVASKSTKRRVSMKVTKSRV